MHVCVKAFYRGLNHQAPFRVFNGDTSGRFNEGLRKKNPEKGQFLHRERERERCCNILLYSWGVLILPPNTSTIKCPLSMNFCGCSISQCFQRYCNSYHNHNHNHNHDHTKCWQVSFNQNWPSQGHMVYLGPKGKAREDKSSWAKSRPI